MGGTYKSWHKRWFVLNVDDKTVKYFSSATAKSEKNGFTLMEISRCYIPKKGGSQSITKHATVKKYLFVIEVS